MNAYPYAARKRLPDYSAVVELTVLGGVPDVRDFVIEAEHASISDAKYELAERLFEQALS